MEMPKMYKTRTVRLGDFFRKLSRYFYSKSPGVCYCCGSRVGLQSIIARGLVWCDDCYNRWQPHILSQDLIWDEWTFGLPKSLREKR